MRLAVSELIFAVKSKKRPTSYETFVENMLVSVVLVLGELYKPLRGWR